MIQFTSSIYTGVSHFENIDLISWQGVLECTINFGLCETDPLEEEDPANLDIFGVTVVFQCVSLLITGLTVEQ